MADPKPTPEELKKSVEMYASANDKAESDKKTSTFDVLKDTVKTALKPKKMAKGGSASSRADGIAVRGKTRGTIC
jgi:hypothetical protein